MFLKFSLSFLFFILAVSCMDKNLKRKASDSVDLEMKTEAEQKNDTIIAEAFANCQKWLSSHKYGFINDNITESDYKMYMGDTQQDWDFIKAYIDITLPTRPDCIFYIHSYLFSELFKIHCQILGKDVEKFAKERKAATKRKDLDGNPVDPIESGDEQDENDMSE